MGVLDTPLPTRLGQQDLQPQPPQVTLEAIRRVVREEVSAGIKTLIEELLIRGGITIT